MTEEVKTLEIGKLELELKIKEKELEIKQKESNSNKKYLTIIAAIIAAFIGLLANLFTTYLNNEGNINLEKEKFETNLILKSLESGSRDDIRDMLSFLIEVGLLEDKADKINERIEKDDIPVTGDLENYVVVREAELRSDRYKLPLNIEDKKALIMYLQRGGDRGQPDIVLPGAKSFYQSLLSFLSTGDSVKLHDLFADSPTGQREFTDSARKWFRGRPVYTVIDSRLNRPNMRASRPFALHDGNFWWIFYRSKDNAKRLESVMVTVPLLFREVFKEWEEE